MHTTILLFLILLPTLHHIISDLRPCHPPLTLHSILHAFRHYLRPFDPRTLCPFRIIRVPFRGIPLLYMRVHALHLELVLHHTRYILHTQHHTDTVIRTCHGMDIFPQSTPTPIPVILHHCKTSTMHLHRRIFHSSIHSSQVLQSRHRIHTSRKFCDHLRARKTSNHFLLRLHGIWCSEASASLMMASIRR